MHNRGSGARECLLIFRDEGGMNGERLEKYITVDICRGCDGIERQIRRMRPKEKSNRCVCVCGGVGWRKECKGYWELQSAYR
jgi:hypothetical protein